MKTRVWQAATTALIFLTILTGCKSAPRQETPAPETVPMRPVGGSSGLAVGHGSGDSATSSPGSMGEAGMGSPTGGQSSAGPLKWTAPAGWNDGPEKPMRAATYLVPAAGGDREGGECAIFVNIGGGVQANIDRWIGQFSQPDGSPSNAKAKQKRETINGFGVTTVDLTGTFNSGGMGMGGATTPKTGYRLLGAIVEAPSGEVFFKLTGPEKTITAAQKDFQSLLKSIR